MNQHRPTVAAVVTGLVGSLLAWGITALPAGVPADVTGWLGAAAILIAGIIGAAAGKVAERKTTPWQVEPPTSDALVPEWDRLDIPERDDVEPPDAEAGH